MNLLVLLVVGGMGMTWVQIAYLYVGELWGFPSYLNVVPLLAYLSIPVVLATAYLAVQMWRGEIGTTGARTRYSLLVVMGLVYILSIFYWQVIG